MKISQLNPDLFLKDILCENPSYSTVELVNKILFYGIEDKGNIGDFVLVFGSPTCLKHRAPKGINLLLEHRANYVVLSGGKRIPNSTFTESQAMNHLFENSGIPKEHIFIENKSMYTHENVIFSAEIMRQKMHNQPFQILAVTSENHMRRVMLNFQHYHKLFPIGTKFYSCPSYSSNSGHENWMKTEKGRKIVARECQSLYNYVKLGYLSDFEF